MGSWEKQSHKRKNALEYISFSAPGVSGSSTHIHQKPTACLSFPCALAPQYA